MKLASLLLTTHTSCVDGREDRAIIGTPGGDAGELLLGLAVAETVTGSCFSKAEISTLTRAFADAFGGIYLHTDSTALSRLALSLREDPRFRDTVNSLSTSDDWDQFLRRPPEALRGALLEHLLEPSHVGCGHLKLALTQPGLYGVRAELITGFFEAFYVGLWDGAPDLHWVVLGGEHAEGAVVNVTFDGEPWPFSEVPMLTPSIDGRQVFVNHPQVVTYIRQQTARFLVSRVAGLPSSTDVDALSDAIAKLGEAQTMATLENLAAGLPVFSIHFDRSGGVVIEEHASIPG